MKANTKHATMQAGAARVYAIEASDMVRHAQKLFDANPSLGSRITLLHGKLEALELPEKADVLISEPMGTLLVNERMLETYIYARRHMLKPGGKMFPGVGRIYVAAFADAALHAEQLGMAAFWANDAFYGVNLRALHADAQVVRSQTSAPGHVVCWRLIGACVQQLLPAHCGAAAYQLGVDV
jgi:type I protein arginine methyltransferase